MDETHPRGTGDLQGTKLDNFSHSLMSMDVFTHVRSTILQQDVLVKILLEYDGLEEEFCYKISDEDDERK